MSPIDSAALASLHGVRHRRVVIEFGTFWVDCELLVILSGILRLASGPVLHSFVFWSTLRTRLAAMFTSFIAWQSVRILASDKKTLRELSTAGVPDLPADIDLMASGVVYAVIPGSLQVGCSGVEVTAVTSTEELHCRSLLLLNQK